MVYRMSDTEAGLKAAEQASESSETWDEVHQWYLDTVQYGRQPRTDSYLLDRLDAILNLAFQYPTTPEEEESA